MNILLVLGVLLAQEFYEPVPKCRRELEALKSSRAEVAAKIQATDDAIKQDPQAFYKAHAGDCEVTRRSPDGAVLKFSYVPSRAWFAQRKRFDAEITTKEEELLGALDAAIAVLAEHEKRLQKRRDVWEKALVRLDKQTVDLGELESEWRRAAMVAAWNFVNEMIPVMAQGFEACGVRLKRPPPESFFSKVPYEQRDRLERAIQRVTTTSSLALHALQAWLADGDASKATQAREHSQKTMEALAEASECAADVLKLVAIGNTKAQLAEMEVLSGGLSALNGILKAVVSIREGGFDEKSMELLKDAAVRGLKFAGEFHPATKVVMTLYGGLNATVEAWTAGSAWWSIRGNVQDHRKNLERARSALEALRKELEAVARRLAEYRAEREPLAKKLGR
jgi:hypothetical protein